MTTIARCALCGTLVVCTFFDDDQDGAYTYLCPTKEHWGHGLKNDDDTYNDHDNDY